MANPLKSHGARGKFSGKVPVLPGHCPWRRRAGAVEGRNGRGAGRGAAGAPRRMSMPGRTFEWTIPGRLRPGAVRRMAGQVTRGRQDPAASRRGETVNWRSATAVQPGRSPGTCAGSLVVASRIGAHGMTMARRQAAGGEAEPRIAASGHRCGARLPRETGTGGCAPRSAIRCPPLAIHSRPVPGFCAAPRAPVRDHGSHRRLRVRSVGAAANQTGDVRGPSACKAESMLEGFALP